MASTVVERRVDVGCAEPVLEVLGVLRVLGLLVLGVLVLGVLMPRVEIVQSAKSGALRTVSTLRTISTSTLAPLAP